MRNRNPNGTYATHGKCVEGKVCSRCKRFLPRSEFYLRNLADSLLQSECKDCYKWRRDQPEAKERKRLEGQSEKAKQRRQVYQSNPSTLRKQRNRYLMRLFKISLEDYEQMVEAQGNKCAICNEQEVLTIRGNRKGIQALAVDHDRKCCPSSRSCGQCVRGLLCYRCNQFLGLARDNVQILQSAINYIQKGKGNDKLSALASGS